MTTKPSDPSGHDTGQWAVIWAILAVLVAVAVVAVFLAPAELGLDAFRAEVLAGSAIVAVVLRAFQLEARKPPKSD